MHANVTVDFSVARDGIGYGNRNFADSRAMAPPNTIETNGIPAGYGRSCISCSKAKCRCILRPKGDSCERCHRLGKECQQMVASRKRTTKKSAASRTAQLEEKLDDLVSILRASQSNGQPSMKHNVSADPESPYPSRLDSLATAAATTPLPSLDAVANCQALPTTHYSPAPSAHIPQLESHSSIAENEACLAKFRSWLQYFPCMHIPADLTIDVLEAERPFLWLSILNLTTMSLPYQRLLRERLREEAARRIIMNNERSMDILLGLIVHIGWAGMNAVPKAQPFMTTFSQLATIVLYDQGLTKSPNEDHHLTVFFRVWRGNPPAPSRVRTMEERRAVLSLWFCISTATGYIGRMESLRWTPHMQECLDVLDRVREQPVDADLAALIKAQLVGEEAQQYILRDSTGGDATETPTYIFRNGLVTRIKQVRECYASQAQTNSMVRAHLNIVEAQALSVGLFGEQLRLESDRTRLNSMYSCFQVVRSWLDDFHAIPVQLLPGQCFSYYIGLSQVHSLLYRLTTVEDPAWDKENFCNTLNVLDVLEQTASKFGRIDAVYPQKMEPNETSLFAKGAMFIRIMKSQWEPHVAHHLKGPPESGNRFRDDRATQHGPVSSNPAIENINMVDASSIDFNDVGWMDVFGPWDFGD